MAAVEKDGAATILSLETPMIFYHVFARRKRNEEEREERNSVDSETVIRMTTTFILTLCLFICSPSTPFFLSPLIIL